MIKNLHYDSINDLAWMKNTILTMASSDGYCSFIKMDPKLIGEILPAEDESMPDCFKDHFTALSEVNFDKKIAEATGLKQSSFTKIAFKSKKQAVDAEMVRTEDPKDSWCGPTGDVEMN